MISENELKSEKKYLNGVIKVLDNELTDLNNNIYDHERNLKATSEYMSNSFYEMDAEEQAVAKNMLEQLQLDIVALNNTRSLRERQKESAYFGRIDFKASDEKEVMPYYIGISHILKPNYPIPLVLDWRAPLASMYYDFELGNANYTAPMGNIKGKIYLKRQYKTKQNKLIYAFDSSLTIGDEILRETLAGNASSKMKNIVSTIQAEQNKIIRADEGKNVIVQGVAGSGKTSIALHRIAYLLYKNKIKSSDILIISPSSLFSDYISNVLPELGEQNTPKITFDEIASNELFGYVNFEPRSQMLEDIIENGNVKRAEEIQIKSGFKFLDALKKFLNKEVSVNFKATDIKLGKQKIEKEIISKLFHERYKTKTPSVRIEWIADYIVDQLNVAKQNEKAVFIRIKKVLFNMFKNTNIIDIYKNFLETQKLTLNSVTIDKNTFIGYEDVPAILYIKDFLIGVETQKHFKHIIIDEMQDYSPIVIELFNKIYPANKTYLGDIYQTFEKILDMKYLNKFVKLIPNSKMFALNTTYRSTMQITKFNQKLIQLEGSENFNRQGEPVEKIKSTSLTNTGLKKIINSLTKKYSSVAVITPSIKLAKQLYNSLGETLNLTLIDENSGEAKQQNIIVPAAFSKGLEFDAVVFVGQKMNTKLAALKENIKYISCTRALHKLIVIE